MCLDTVDKVTKKKRTGYKVVRKIDDTHVYGVYYGGKIPVGEWVEDKSRGRIKVCRRNIGYPKGFHLYNNLKDASAMTWGGRCTYKVRMRKVVASGTQEDMPVTVCREIFIGEEEE